MKPITLRYIRNLYYYDGPLTDLFVGQDDFDLYASFIVTYDEDEWIYIVRKIDEEFKNHEFYPDGWFDLRNKDIPFLTIDFKNLKEHKEWNEKFPYWIIEATPITDEQREKYKEETNAKTGS